MLPENALNTLCVKAIVVDVVVVVVIVVSLIVIIAIAVVATAAAAPATGVVCQQRPSDSIVLGPDAADATRNARFEVNKQFCEAATAGDLANPSLATRSNRPRMYAKSLTCNMACVDNSRVRTRTPGCQLSMHSRLVDLLLLLLHFLCCVAL